MKGVAIVTDSTAMVPEELERELNIHVVPVLLLFGSQAYRDGVDITPAEVYQRLRVGEQIPTSAAPSVGDFLRVYASVGQQASSILSIHMSPQLSATYNVAVMASGLVDTVPVRVLNCQNAAMGQGFVALEAARAAALGATLDQVQARAEEVARKTNLLFTLDTFEYLHRSGRIGGAAALMGAMLQIKPILYLDDGHIGVLRKPRTRPKALRMILDQIGERAGGRPLHAAVCHVDVQAEAEALRQRVAERFKCVELYVAEFTPVVGAHTGPGLLGVAFYPE